MIYTSADIGFVTNDVIRLRSFYEAVFGGKAEGDEYHSALALDGVSFSFSHVGVLKENKAFYYVSADGANNVTVSFFVDDADAEYNRLLKLGGEMLNEPTNHPWGARSFQIKDPDGNILNFRCPVNGV